MGHRPCPLVCLGWTSSPSFVSSVRSSSVYPGLLPTYIHTYPATFFRFFRFGAMLPIYIIHSLITFTLIQCSIYRTEPGNTFTPLLHQILHYFLYESHNGQSYFLGYFLYEESPSQWSDIFLLAGKWRGLYRISAWAANKTDYDERHCYVNTSTITKNTKRKITIVLTSPWSSSLENFQEPHDLRGSASNDS